MRYEHWIYLLLLMTLHHAVMAAIVDDASKTQQDTPLLIPVLANDTDENLDAVFANSNTNRQCRGDGMGNFTCSQLDTTILNSRDVALGDINQDGFIDAVFASQPSFVCLNNTQGRFSTCQAITSEELHYSHAVSLGDLDGDGQLDAIFANSQAKNRVCWGNGAGNFSCTDMPDFGINGDSLDVDLGYIDEDEYLDAVFANGAGNTVRCLSNKAGNFNCDSNIKFANNGKVASGALSVTLGHLNQDGWSDLILGNAGPTSDPTKNSACLNYPDMFKCTGILDLPSSAIKDILIGNLNNDNKSYIIFAGQSESKFCLNITTPTKPKLGACKSIDNTSNEEAVALGDLNHDKKPDLFFAGNNSKVCLNDGTGNFPTCNPIDAGAPPSHSVTLGHLGLDVTSMSVESTTQHGGTAGLNTDGTISYIPPPAFTGTDHFTYTIEGTTATVTVNVFTEEEDPILPGEILPPTPPDSIVHLPLTMTLHISFPGLGTGQVTSEPRGIKCKSADQACQWVYATQTRVKLTPRADPGSQFIGWGGYEKCGATEGVTLVKNMYCKAYFMPVPPPETVTITPIVDDPPIDVPTLNQPPTKEEDDEKNSKTYTLTVTKTGPGQIISDSPGIDCGSICTASYSDNTQINLTAHPDSYFAFTGFQGDCDATGQVILDADKTCDIHFEAIRAELKVSVVGQGQVHSEPAGIECGQQCVHTYPALTTVKLIPTAAPGWQFAGFQGGRDCQQETMLIKLGQQCQATFIPEVKTTPGLMIGLRGDVGRVVGDGIACGDDCIEHYDQATLVNLTAEPAPGVAFSYWAGDCHGYAASTTVMADAMKTCIAHFCAFPALGFDTAGQRVENGTCFSGLINTIYGLRPNQVALSESEAQSVTLSLQAMLDPQHIGQAATMLYRIHPPASPWPNEQTLRYLIETTPSDSYAALSPTVDWGTQDDFSEPTGPYAGLLAYRLADGTIFYNSPDTLSFSVGKQPMAIELIDFEAKPTQGRIALTWQTAAEVDHAGFHLWRALKGEAGRYVQVRRLTEQLIGAQGNARSGFRYVYWDDSALRGQVYYYGLESVDIKGARHFWIEAIETAVR